MQQHLESGTAGTSSVFYLVVQLPGLGPPGFPKEPRWGGRGYSTSGGKGRKEGAPLRSAAVLTPPPANHQQLLGLNSLSHSSDDPPPHPPPPALHSLTWGPETKSREETVLRPAPATPGRAARESRGGGHMTGTAAPHPLVAASPLRTLFSPTSGSFSSLHRGPHFLRGRGAQAGR